MSPSRGAGAPEQLPGSGGEPFRILFVCTGNTCRSPMSEALARAELARRGWWHVEVESAGASAVPGLPASGGALRVAARHGLDLSAHRGQGLSRELVERADLVLAMSPHHLAAVRARGGEGKSALIADFAEGREGEEGGRSVADPFGGGDEVYEATFRELRDLVGRALDRLASILDP